MWTFGFANPCPRAYAFDLFSLRINTLHGDSSQDTRRTFALELENMKINDLNIGTRLGGAFGAVLFLMVIMLASALWQFARIAEAKSVMAEASHKAMLAKDWAQGIATN